MNDFEIKQMSKISAQLLQDVKLLEKAYDFTIKGTSTFLEIATNDEIVHTTTLDYSMWAYCEFEKNKEKYYAFLDNYLKTRKVSGNTLFGFSTPDRDSPNEEADRILDRIDLALNFFKTNLDIELPHELRSEINADKYSIRNGGWEQEKLLKRVKSFAQSTYDLFKIDDNSTTKK